LRALGTKDAAQYLNGETYLYNKYKYLQHIAIYTDTSYMRYL